VNTYRVTHDGQLRPSDTPAIVLSRRYQNREDRQVIVTMRATFSETLWESDEPDTDPTITDGFIDPRTPWGGFDVEVPDGLCGEAFTAWEVDNVDTITFDNLWDAAEFVVSFPGGVWDFSEGEGEQDARTGAYREVTLHVQDHVEAVFNLAEFVQTYNARPVAV
jgi:hypothetical protein